MCIQSGSVLRANSSHMGVKVGSERSRSPTVPNTTAALAASLHLVQRLDGLAFIAHRQEPSPFEPFGRRPALTADVTIVRTIESRLEAGIGSHMSVESGWEKHLNVHRHALKILQPCFRIRKIEARRGHREIGGADQCARFPRFRLELIQYHGRRIGRLGSWSKRMRLQSTVHVPTRVPITESAFVGDLHRARSTSGENFRQVGPHPRAHHRVRVGIEYSVTIKHYYRLPSRLTGNQLNQRSVSTVGACLILRKLFCSIASKNRFNPWPTP
jgi:hypothetical protein